MARRACMVLAVLLPASAAGWSRQADDAAVDAPPPPVEVPAPPAPLPDPARARAMELAAARADILGAARITQAQIQYAGDLAALMELVNSLAPDWPVIQGMVGGPVAELLEKAWRALPEEAPAEDPRAPPPPRPQREAAPRPADFNPRHVVAIGCGIRGLSRPYVLVRTGPMPAALVAVGGDYTAGGSTWTLTGIEADAAGTLTASFRGPGGVRRAVTDSVGPFRAENCEGRSR